MTMEHTYAMAEAITEQKKRDWAMALLPTVLAVGASLAVVWAGDVRSAGATAERIDHMEERQKADEADMKDALKNRDTAQQLRDQELNIQFHRIDDRLERIMEYQTNRTEGKH